MWCCTGSNLAAWLPGGDAVPTLSVVEACQTVQEPAKSLGMEHARHVGQYL